MWMLPFAAFAVLASRAHAHLVSTCVIKDQCGDGFYCEPKALICLKCLDCADYQRELRPTIECVKAIGDCGPCLEGFVVDQRGDLKCVSPQEAEGAPSYYIWGIVVGVLLVVIFLIVVIFVYIFKGNILKISTRTLLRPSCPSMEGPAPAAEQPPPYNPYSPVRTDPPPFNQVHYVNTHQDQSEAFVKQVPSPYRPQNVESEENQNARVFNRPAYLRHRPPSPEITDLDDKFSPIQDEATSESTWTPTADSNNVNGNEASSETATNSNVKSSSDLPTLLAAARDTTLVEPPPKKTKVQDGNNNGSNGMDKVSSESTSSGAHAHSAPAHSAPAPTPATFLNIQVNNTLGTSFTGQMSSVSR